MSRPLRLVAAAHCLLVLAQDAAAQETLFRRDGIEIKKVLHVPFGKRAADTTVLQLVNGGIAFGAQHAAPADATERGHPERDFSRLPITYYHPNGPLGLMLRKYDWAPGPVNTYAADARLPAYLVGLSVGWEGPLPFAPFCASWSEPSIGIVSLWTGAPAGYARPYQTMHIFERRPIYVELSSPAKDKPGFTYVADARERGANIEIFEGEFRPTLEKKAARGFYQVIVVECIKDGHHEPLNESLLTKEGMSLFLEMLAPDGVLCYHTSHRYIDLPGGLVGTGKALKLASVVGFSEGDTENDRDHWASEWVFLARDPEAFKSLPKPKVAPKRPRPAWDHDAPAVTKVWSDDDFPMAGLYRANPGLHWVEEVGHELAKGLGALFGGKTEMRTFEAIRGVRGALEAMTMGKLNDPRAEKKRAARP